MKEEKPTPAFPGPWQDPDFSPGAATWGKSGPGSTADAAGDDRARSQPARYQQRIRILALFALVVWAGVLFDLMLGRLVLELLLAIGAGLIVIAGAMALGIMGHGLFAAGDLLIAWLRKGTRWPEE